MSEENVDNSTEKQLGGITGKGFMPGVSGNPAGRPKGSISIKDKVRQHLEEHPEEVEEIVKHFVKNNRELMWQMLEGRPYQDILSGGEKLPTPILNVFPNNSDNQDKPNEQKDTSGTGGNVSQ